MKRGIALAVAGVWVAAVVACGDDDATSPPVDAGVESSTSVVPPSGDGPISPEVAARFAILVGSCDPSTKAESILRRLYDDDSPRHLRAIATCAAARNNGCAALTECAGDTYLRNGADCKSRCDGDVVETCDDGILERRDCAKRGLRCLTNANGGLPQCSDPDAPFCDAGAGSTTCRDGVARGCSDNDREVRGTKCEELGLTCDPAGCKGSGESCAGPSTSEATIRFVGTTCDGTKVRACVNGGLASFDCGRHIVGATCQSDGSGISDSATCGLGTACKLSTVGLRSCEGDSAVICNRGRLDRVDCKALGFTGCLVQDGEDKAVCTPGVQ